LRFHEVPEDEIVKLTPRKRKRDRDITEYFPITPKTPRTRDVHADGEESDDDIYEMSDRDASPSSRHRGRFHPLHVDAEITRTILNYASRFKPNSIATEI
jgi:hypothetical protein